jgi:lytic murein transglycosylase
MNAHRVITASLLLALHTAPVLAARCGHDESGFSSWLGQFKKEAEAKGISSKTLSSALGGVGYEERIINLDRSQKSFKLSFSQFYARRVDGALISKGRSLMQTHAGTLSRIENKYGVPAEVVVAIWGLETGYGRNSGNTPAFPSLATLAYDCRRSEFFTNELMSALRVVQRGDMSPSQFRGAWAGEVGQTQFLPSSYEKYAVDFDGNGRRDLINSIPDVLASTANYLHAYGWKKGAPWTPGSHNYQVLYEWNKADVYVQTIAKMASQMGG